MESEKTKKLTKILSFFILQKMEIWIIGGIIVALMVYASTRIKRSAALAFERETIETRDFTIVKPEGFINPVESEFAFEAYTKDFGREDTPADELRQAQAQIVVKNDSDGEKAGVTESETSEKDVPVKVFRKILRADDRTFELKISVLQDHEEDYRARVNEMLDSFVLK